MKKVRSVDSIRDPYSKRILSNILNQDALGIYSKTPKDLKRLTRGLTKEQIYKPPAKGRWSIAQLLSHLCDAEWAMGFRIRMAIAQSGSHLQAYDQERWADKLHYDKSDWKEKLTLFTSLRQAHLSLLRSLKPSEWQGYGIHEERGKETVERMVHMLAGHDVNHLRQIDSIRRSLVKKKRS